MEGGEGRGGGCKADDAIDEARRGGKNWSAVADGNGAGPVDSLRPVRPLGGGCWLWLGRVRGQPTGRIPRGRGPPPASLPHPTLAGAPLAARCCPQSTHPPARLARLPTCTNPHGAAAARVGGPFLHSSSTAAPKQPWPLAHAGLLLLLLLPVPPTESKDHGWFSLDWIGNRPTAARRRADMYTGT